MLRTVPFNSAEKLTEFVNNAESVLTATVVEGGEGYSVDDLLTVEGGSPVSSSVLKVTSVTDGAIDTVDIVHEGGYLGTPENPVSVSGPGTGATFDLAVASTISGRSDIKNIRVKNRWWYLNHWYVVR